MICDKRLTGIEFFKPNYYSPALLRNGEVDLVERLVAPLYIQAEFYNDETLPKAKEIIESAAGESMDLGWCSTNGRTLDLIHLAFPYPGRAVVKRLAEEVDLSAIRFSGVRRNNNNNDWILEDARGNNLEDMVFKIGFYPGFFQDGPMVAQRGMEEILEYFSSVSGKGASIRYFLAREVPVRGNEDLIWSREKDTENGALFVGDPKKPSVGEIADLAFRLFKGGAQPKFFILAIELKWGTWMGGRRRRPPFFLFLNLK